MNDQIEMTNEKVEEMIGFSFLDIGFGSLVVALKKWRSDRNLR
jgi:hypothetical protein